MTAEIMTPPPVAPDMPPKRLTIRGLSPFHYKWGRIWAYCKARTLSRLVVDVFEARVEGNLDLIKLMAKDIAEQRGITIEALIEEILKGESEEEP